MVNSRRMSILQSHTGRPTAFSLGAIIQGHMLVRGLERQIPWGMCIYTVGQCAVGQLAWHHGSGKKHISEWQIPDFMPLTYQYLIFLFLSLTPPFKKFLVTVFFLGILLLIRMSIRMEASQVKNIKSILLLISVLLKRNYMEMCFPLIHKCHFFIMLIFLIPILTLMSISTDNLELTFLLELILNGLHFHFASTSLSKKNWEISSANK